MFGMFYIHFEVRKLDPIGVLWVFMLPEALALVN